MTQQEKQYQPFNSWAHVEILGHRSHTGHVSETTVAGMTMLEVHAIYPPQTPEGLKADLETWPYATFIYPPHAIHGIEVYPKEDARSIILSKMGIDDDDMDDDDDEDFEDDDDDDFDDDDDDDDDDDGLSSFIPVDERIGRAELVATDGEPQSNVSGVLTETGLSISRENLQQGTWSEVETSTPNAGGDSSAN